MSHQLKEAAREGSYYIAVVCLFLLSMTIPGLNIVSVWFLPLPFVILGVLHNRSTTTLVGVFLVLSSLFLSEGMGLYLVASFITGYFMGRVYREPHTSASQVVLGGMVGATLSFFTCYYLGDALSSVGRVLQKEWDQGLDHAVKMTGIKPESLPPIETVIPICILSFMVIIVLLNLWAARKWLTYKGFPGKYLPRFHNWNLPKSFFHVYFIAVLWQLFIGEGSEEPMMQYLTSFLLIMGSLFLIQGVSFLTYLLYINKWKRSWIILFLPILISTPLAIFVEMIGVLDTGAGLKRMLKKK